MEAKKQEYPRFGKQKHQGFLAVNLQIKPRCCGVFVKKTQREPDLRHGQ